MKDVPIVSAATVYILANARSYILVFNDALYMEYVEHTLINPNQFRNFGAELQDNPYDQKNTMKITIPEKKSRTYSQRGMSFFWALIIPL